MMQRLYTALIICLAGFAVAVEVYVPETWSDSSVQGWRCMDQAVALPNTNRLSVVGGMLQMEPEPEGPQTPRWSFVADQDASEGRFTGSYYDAGVDTLSFRLSSSCPATMTVELVNDTDFIIYNASLDIAAGAEEISLPVSADTFRADFFASGSFENLLRSVEDIWITFEWSSGENPPVFAVDDVLLTGAGPGYGVWIDGFGNITNSALRLSGADADGDGIRNGEEFIVDSEPDRAGVPFQIRCAADTLQWNSSSNCLYTVLRSTNLIEQGFVEIGTVPGTGAEVIYQDPEQPVRASYRVRAKRKN